MSNKEVLVCRKVVMRFLPRTLFSVIALIFFWPAPSAQCSGLWQYFKDYQLGVEANTNIAASVLSYDAARITPLPTGCQAQSSTDDSKKMGCSVDLVETDPVTYALLFQQPFKRTGWLYFRSDLGFSVFGVNARLEKPTTQVWTQPLKSAAIHLYGLNTKYYVKFGITPPWVIPDLLFSVGLGMQNAYGSVVIDGQHQSFSSEGLLVSGEFEIVWIRWFKDTLLISSEVTLETAASFQNITGRTIDKMNNFALAQANSTISWLKLVLPIP